MGKRKLRFFVTKNYERKKRTLQVQPQSSAMSSALVLTVSIPYSVFTAAAVNNVAQLHSRAKAANCLPQNWVYLTSPESTLPRPSLLLCRLKCQPPLYDPQVVYNVQIDQHLRWALTVFNKPIENGLCSLCTSMLRNVDSMVALLQKIEEGKLCTGNSDKQFVCLAEQQGGVLMDQ